MSFEGKNQWKEDIKIAKDLLYPSIVIEKLKNEPDPIIRSRILNDARNGLYDKSAVKATPIMKGVE